MQCSVELGPYIMCHHVICLSSYQAPFAERLLSVYCNLTIKNELEAVFEANRDDYLHEVADLAIGSEIHVHRLRKPVVPLSHDHDIVHHLR